MSRWHLLLLLLLPLFVFSCRPNENFLDSPDAKLEFATDTVIFDTVFTTVGSATEVFLIYNRHNRPMKIEQIRLTGGPASPFRVNIDGQPTTSLHDYTIHAGDSIWVFVDVKIDPVSGNLPFVVKDSLIFITNGNYQDVKLVAWGQNAHFLRDSIIECNTTWTADLPYVIYNYVYIPPGCTLTIEEGVQIHGHNEAIFGVGGTLIVKGTKDNPVVFQGDKLDRWYTDVPHQWFGILMEITSEHNSFNHAIIKNGTIGLLVDGGPASSVTLTNSEIHNMSNLGILSINGNINGTNLIVSNCGQRLLAAAGGNYNFTHSTFANYNFRFARKAPSIVLGDFDYVGAERPVNSLKFRAVNSVIWGTLESELEYESRNPGTWELTLDHSLLKIKNTDGFNVNNNILNKDPLFSEPQKYDFEPGENSPLIGAGKPIPTITTDRFENPRKPNPDIGAIERQ